MEDNLERCEGCEELVDADERRWFHDIVVCEFCYGEYESGRCS